MFDQTCGQLYEKEYPNLKVGVEGF